MDSAALPTVVGYLDKLPRGLESYPQAVIKGSIVRAMLAVSGLSGLLAPGLLPLPVEDLVRHPPGVTDWVPETYYATIVSAVFDLRFRNAGGQAAFESLLLEANRRLLRGSLYRVLFLVLRPARILSGTEKRWATFHRGSCLSVASYNESSARVRLTHPPFLFGDLSLGGFARAFQAALEAAGGKSAQVFARIESETSTLYQAEWGSHA
jgi:hypothetical protein